MISFSHLSPRNPVSAHSQLKSLSKFWHWPPLQGWFAHSSMSYSHFSPVYPGTHIHLKSYEKRKEKDISRSWNRSADSLTYKCEVIGDTSSTILAWAVTFLAKITFFITIHALVKWFGITVAITITSVALMVNVIWKKKIIIYICSRINYHTYLYVYYYNVYLLFKMTLIKFNRLWTHLFHSCILHRCDRVCLHRFDFSTVHNYGHGTDLYNRKCNFRAPLFDGKYHYFCKVCLDIRQSLHYTTSHPIRWGNYIFLREKKKKNGLD